MRLMISVLLCLFLCGCNSVYYKPNTLDKTATIYTPRGGETMQRSLKEVFDERGYKTHVGKLTSVVERNPSDIEFYSQPKNIKYSVIIDEQSAILRPIWCVFNGFWWWRFTLAISDRETGQEILSWRGRGCANSSVRKLNDILDDLEMKEPPKKQKKHKIKKTNFDDINAGLIILAQPEKK